MISAPSPSSSILLHIWSLHLGWGGSCVVGPPSQRTAASETEHNKAANSGNLLLQQRSDLLFCKDHLELLTQDPFLIKAALLSPRAAPAPSFPVAYAQHHFLNPI